MYDDFTEVIQPEVKYCDYWRWLDYSWTKLCTVKACVDWAMKSEKQ